MDSAFSSFGVDAVKGSATVASSDETITCFHRCDAITSINGDSSEVLRSMRRVKLRSPGFNGSTKIGVRFGVHFGPSGSQLLAAKSVRSGASCRI